MEEELKEKSFVNRRASWDTEAPIGAEGRGCFLYHPIEQNQERCA